MRRAKTPVFIGLLFINTLTMAYNDTPNYWKCDDKRGGEWIFGRAPNICDTDNFIDMTFVERNFQEAIFFDSLERSEERERYMGELYSVIKETAEYFIKTKKVNVSEVEKNEFVHAAFAIAHQESYWSHYRQAISGHTQFMRGDYGHGHGIMQVDDRWHFEAVTSGRASNLIYNMLYSLEEYYTAWKRAPSQSCVKSETNWVARARASYSAYNGGPSRICRFTNPNDKWARNDKGFYDKYKNKAWEKYAHNFREYASVDVACIAEGGENCRRGNFEPEPTELKEDTFYETLEGPTCVFRGDKLHCVENIDDKLCLVKDYAPKLKTEETTKLTEEVDFPQVIHERHTLCQSIPGLYKVGSKITLSKNINLRASPGGKLLLTTKKSQTYTILDFFIISIDKFDRYYKIKSGNSEGYIYSGTNKDYASWSTPSESSKESLNSIIAEKGDKIRILQDMKMYDNQLNEIGILSKDAIVEVQAKQVKGEENSVYYSVLINNYKATIYAGDLIPINTVQYRVEMIKDSDKEIFGKLKNGIWYRSLRSCESTQCSRIIYVRGPVLGAATFKIISTGSKWTLVEISGKRGYLETKDISKI